jgi:hypothetical protein
MNTSNLESSDPGLVYAREGSSSPAEIIVLIATPTKRPGAHSSEYLRRAAR